MTFHTKKNTTEEEGVERLSFNLNMLTADCSTSYSVTITNVQGASGTMASGYFVPSKSDTWGHYSHDDGRDHTIGDTFWSTTLGTTGTKSNYSNWFGSHNGGAYGNSDMWFTMDYGANPSFKIKKLTGYTEWRTSSAVMYFYGSNSLNSLNGSTTGSSDAGSANDSGWTILVNNLNIMSTSWDTGFFTNNTFFRYYMIRVVVGGGIHDWGFKSIKYYGDYY